MYERQIATAKRLLAKFGEQSVLRRYVKGADLGAGEPGPNASYEDVTVPALYLPPGSVGKSGVGSELGYMPNMDVPAGAEIVYMAVPSNGWEPLLTDELYRAADTGFTQPLKIVNRDKLAPNGTPIIYTLVVTQ